MQTFVRNSIEPLFIRVKSRGTLRRIAPRPFPLKLPVREKGSIRRHDCPLRGLFIHTRHRKVVRWSCAINDEAHGHDGSTSPYRIERSIRPAWGWAREHVIVNSSSCFMETFGAQRHTVHLFSFCGGTCLTRNRSSLLFSPCANTSSLSPLAIL